MGLCVCVCVVGLILLCVMGGGERCSSPPVVENKSLHFTCNNTHTHTHRERERDCQVMSSREQRPARLCLYVSLLLFILGAGLVQAASNSGGVLERGLVQEAISHQSVLAEHNKYCPALVQIKTFANPTLVYVTPWYAILQ